MPGAGLLWRARQKQSDGDDPEARGYLQGRGQDLRVQGLSRCAARLQRRLSAELQRRRGEGWLGPNAGVVQEKGRRLILDMASPAFPGQGEPRANGAIGTLSANRR